jgi:hypothetical protein
MTAQRRDPSLDELIAEITVDCYGEDEELMGFENAFDEQGNFPCLGSVIGDEVQVLSVATHDGRRELIATCERRGCRYELALLDIELHTDTATERLLTAYRQWAAHR